MIILLTSVESYSMLDIKEVSNQIREYANILDSTLEQDNEGKSLILTLQRSLFPIIPTSSRWSRTLVSLASTWWSEQKRATPRSRN